MSALRHLLALVIATAGGAAEVGPPPGPPAYLSNARVAALWEWSLAAWEAIGQQNEVVRLLAARVAELESSGPSSSDLAEVTFRWVEGHGRDSVYLVQTKPATPGEWESLPPPWWEPDPDPLPDPSPEPIGLPVATVAAWFAIPATEWTTRGGPTVFDGQIGFFAPGNWLEYDVPAGSWSRVSIGFGVPHAGGALVVSVGAESRTVQVPNTGGYSIPVELVVDLPIQGPARLRIAGATPPGPGYWVGDLHALTLIP